MKFTETLDELTAERLKLKNVPFGGRNEGDKKGVARLMTKDSKKYKNINDNEEIKD